MGHRSIQETLQQKYIPSDGLWPGEDHEVELAVTIVDEVAGVTTFLEHGVLGPVFRVGGIVGHQLLYTFDIDALAIETVVTEFVVEELDEFVKILGDGDTLTVSSSSMDVLGHGRDRSQGHG